VTVTRGFALCFAVVLAGAFAGTPGLEADASATVRLKTITSRVNGKGAALVIEASEPVAYLTTRPDPLTVLVDFRNVDAEGVANLVKASPKSPIAGVTIEREDSLGVPMSRVRISLALPVMHRVRSERNTVVVDFDKASANALPYVMPPASRTAPEAMEALQVPGGINLPQNADPMTALGPGEQAARPRTPRPPPAPQPAPTPPLLPLTPQTPSIGNSVTDPATVLHDQAVPGQPALGGEQKILPMPGARKFTGNPISLDFQGADLRAVLRTFAEISGLNIVIDPTVQGTVDVALRDVPWDQALDIILRANKLGYLIDGTIVRIAPLAALADEEALHQKVIDQQTLTVPLSVMTKTLSYAKAEELQGLLIKSALSQRGTVQIDPRTNTLIITDLPERLSTATDLITALDRPQPQVEIEARIVQTNKTYARALGVQWGFNGQATPALGNTTGLAFPNSGSLGGRVGGGTAAAPAAVALGAATPTSAVGLALGSINGAFNLDVALSALESSGNGRLLSTPKVSTLNNVAAEMTQGVEIPIPTQAAVGVPPTVSFKMAALTLKVTPHITAANTVIMQIALENATPDFGRQVGGIPPINTQRANTTVLVGDGQTTVIGGIYTSNATTTKDSTPGLGNVPILRWLFRRDTLNDANTELLIFITPRIIKS
jgi:type IV pilus secretin PilQ/predicted competence protein